MALSHEKQIYRGILAAIVCLLVMVGIAAWAVWSYRSSSVLVRHATEVARQIDSVQMALKDLQIDFRNFLTTAGPDFPASYERQYRRLEVELAALQRLTANDAVQQKRLAEIQPHMPEVFERLRGGVQARQGAGPEAAAAALGFPGSQSPIDAIHRTLEEMRNNELSLTATRQLQADQSGLAGVAVLVVGFAFCGVLLMLLHRMIRGREMDAQALQRRAEQVSDLYHNAPCGYHSVNADGVFLSINDTELRWLGYEREELVGKKRHADLLTPESRQRYVQVFAQFKLEGGVRDVRFDLVRKDGTILPVLVNSSMIRDADGNFVGTRTTLYDYTERKQLENIQREFQALFESLPGACLVLKPDFTIAAVTDEFLKATMTTREQILGRHLFEVFPDNPDEPEATGESYLRASLERVLKSGLPDTMAIQRYDIRRPDGAYELRYWSPINSPVFGGDHTIEYIIHRVEDVTPFVTREQKGGEDLQVRLERMEAEIYTSAQATEAANQKLRLANEELESFSYSVSHDLRAPLRHISGFSQMLEQQLGAKLEEKPKHYLRTIAASARQMGVLIDGLLAFSRIGRSEMKIQRVSLSSVVHNVVQNLAQESGERKISWAVAALPDVEGDPVLLHQVFANLLGNAVKYTAKVEATRIEVGTEPGEDGMAHIYVKDNGAGFDPKYAGKLFGVFQRLHSAREFEGNGVGLATVRRIVLRHGGRAWADGAPGAGAKFTVSLRLAGPQEALPIQ